MIPVAQPAFDFDAVAHEYRVGDRLLVGVTAAIRAAGLDTDWSFLAPRYRQRGQAVHEATVWLEEDGDLDWDHTHPEVVPFARAWGRFLADTGFETEIMEQIVGSAVYGVAGRLDRGGKLNGQRVILDIKSGKPSHPAVDLQTALYAYLAKASLGYVAEGRVAVWLRPEMDPPYKILRPSRALAIDVQDGLACVRLYWLRAKHGLLGNGGK